MKWPLHIPKPNTEQWNHRYDYHEASVQRFTQNIDLNAHLGTIVTEVDSIRLIVEERPDHWQLFVYDTEKCEVLYTAERMNCDSAKVAAVEFAVAHLYSTDHDLKPEVLSQMLVWEPPR